MLWVFNCKQLHPRELEYKRETCKACFNNDHMIGSSYRNRKKVYHSLPFPPDCRRRRSVCRASGLVLTDNSEGIYLGEKRDCVDRSKRSKKGPIRGFLRVISGVECGLYHLVSMSCVTLPKCAGSNHRIYVARSYLFSEACVFARALRWTKKIQ